MRSLPEVWMHVAQLVMAFLLALPIAWDRERHERSAGLRTFTLVAISTCAFLIAARTAFEPSNEAQSRVWQGLLTGIGFIGSGAILKTGTNVRGTATAASIWSTAAVGAAVAYHQYDIAVLLSVAVFAVLRWLAPFKSSGAEGAFEGDRRVGAADRRATSSRVSQHSPDPSDRSH